LSLIYTARWRVSAPTKTHKVLRESFCKGAYDVSYIDTLEEFNFIKTDVRKDVPIPFWTVYSLYERYGNEFYAFDKKFTWILALTHEKEIYLYAPLRHGK